MIIFMYFQKMMFSLRYSIGASIFIIFILMSNLSHSQQGPVEKLYAQLNSRIHYTKEGLSEKICEPLGSIYSQAHIN